MLFLCIPSIYYLYHYFNPLPSKPKDSIAQIPNLTTNSSIGSANTSDNEVKKTSDLKWRVVGRLTNHNQTTFVVTDGQATQYLTDPPNVHITQFSIELQMPNGEIASSNVQTTAPSKGIL